MCARVEQALLAAKEAQARSKNFDVVERPKHYNQGKIEVIDFIEDQKLDFRAGNVVKYVCRQNEKNGLEDLKKARWYLCRIINELEAERDSLLGYKEVGGDVFGKDYE